MSTLVGTSEAVVVGAGGGPGPVTAAPSAPPEDVLTCLLVGLDDTHGITWTGTTPTALTPPYAANYSAYAINAAGVVAGSADSLDTFLTKPVLWTNGVPSLLSTLPGASDAEGEAYDINDAGVACGWSNGSDDIQHAVYWDADGTIHQLDDATVPFGEAFAINNAGLACGDVRITGGFARAAFWDTTVGSAVTVLPLPSGYTSFAGATGSCINAAGEIVGSILEAALPFTRSAVVWRGGSIVILGPANPTDSSTQATGIDDDGTIVGRGSGPVLWPPGSGSGSVPIVLPSTTFAGCQTVSGSVVGGFDGNNAAYWVNEVETILDNLPDASFAEVTAIGPCQLVPPP